MSVFKFMNLSVQQVVNEVSSLNTIVFPIESDAGNEQSLASTEAELFINCNTWKNPFQLQLAKMLINLGYRLLLVRVNYNDNRTNIRIVDKNLFSYFNPNKEYEYNGNLENVTNIRDITETLGTLTKRLYYNNCILLSHSVIDQETHTYYTYNSLQTNEESDGTRLDPYILIKSDYTFLVIFTDNPEKLTESPNNPEFDLELLLKYPRSYDRLVIVDIRDYKNTTTLKGLIDDIALKISSLTGYSYQLNDEMILLESTKPLSIDTKSNITNLKVEYNQNDDYDEFTSKLINDPAMILISKQPDSIEDLEVEITNVSEDQLGITISRLDSSNRSLYSESYVCDRNKDSDYSVESLLARSNLILFLDAGIDFYKTDISGKYRLKYVNETETTLDNYISTLKNLEIDEDITDVAYIVDSMIYYSISEYWYNMKYDSLNRPYGRPVDDSEFEEHKDDLEYIEFLNECKSNYELYGKPRLGEPETIARDRATYNALIDKCNEDYEAYKSKVYEYHKVLSELALSFEAVEFVSDPPYLISDYELLYNCIYFTPNMTYGVYTIPTYYVMLSLLADSRYNGDVTTTMDLNKSIINETTKTKCLTEFIDYQYLINDGWLLESFSNSYRSMYYILATYVVKKFIITYIDENFIGNYSNVDFTDLFNKLQDRFNKIILSATLEDYYVSTNTLNATILITYKEKNKYVYKININLTLN